MYKFDKKELDAILESSYSDGVRYAINYVINELGIDISDSDLAEEYLLESKGE